MSSDVGINLETCDMSDIKQPILDSNVETEIWYKGTDREIRGRALSDVGGYAKIGFGLLELGPDCNTRPAHYHTMEEEHLYVLEGSGTLHLDDKTHPLSKGSYAHFPAGQKVHHCLSTDKNESLKYIIVGERIKQDKVFYRDDKNP